MTSQMNDLESLFILTERGCVGEDSRSHELDEIEQAVVVLDQTSSFLESITTGEV